MSGSSLGQENQEKRRPDDETFRSDESLAGDGVHWDEGLAHHRTELAWGRTGLAVVVVSAILMRRLLTLPVVAAVIVGLLVTGGLGLWTWGMRTSRHLLSLDSPHGLAGNRALVGIALGTVLLAAAALFLALAFPA